MNTGKCPKCAAPIHSVKTEQITSEPLPGKQLHEGVSYLCPSCHTVLGVNLTPSPLQQEALES
jgi:uncharacterized protein with PIN domain